MDNELKEHVKEIRRLITIVTKWPKWKVTIKATTPQGNVFDYKAEFPAKKEKK